ncbi:MAG: glycosyltransferase family 4 protein [Desulfobulbaceae bacterium]|nr:glycosyltransferase family 4 protein [Desulfobulbaceae bacterium]
MTDFSKLKVAIIHYWLVGMRGGEKVLEELCTLFPQAEIFTHVLAPHAISPLLRQHKIHTTFINRLPGAQKHYQKYLPLMPMALEELDLRGFDLVISSESGPAKGVITHPDCLHICYCHSPMRYVWNMYHDYKAEAGVLTRLLMGPLFHYLRQWDQLSSARVDHFLANSTAVQARIGKYYRRQATVIPPPVDTESFTLAADQPGDYYLVCGQLVGYKRVDLAVAACNRNGRPLVVIGGGEMLRPLQKRAAANIRFLGPQPLAILREHYQHCRALLFPGEEDFGIVPLEAMACGRPVIAYGKGGALDTVVPGLTGILFPEQTAEALLTAMADYEAHAENFAPEAIRAHALQFSRELCRQRLIDFISLKLSAPGK